MPHELRTEILALLIAVFQLLMTAAQVWIADRIHKLHHQTNAQVANVNRNTYDLSDIDRRLKTLEAIYSEIATNGKR